jgi:hypothetical protein
VGWRRTFVELERSRARTQGGLFCRWHRQRFLGLDSVSDGSSTEVSDGSDGGENGSDGSNRMVVTEVRDGSDGERMVVTYW